MKVAKLALCWDQSIFLAVPQDQEVFFSALRQQQVQRQTQRNAGQLAARYRRELGEDMKLRHIQQNLSNVFGH